MDPVELVRRGYDAVSYRYRPDDAAPVEYTGWVAWLRAALPPGAAVLDLGCGCGVPVARALAAGGFRVTGVDVSEVQLARARALVPDATFVRADVTALDLPPASVDAVVCLYVLIHLPLAAQPALLARVASWLRPGGLLLATAGQSAWTGTDPDWLGGGAPMWWEQADAAAYRRWLADAGLEVTAQEFVPEGAGGHALFRARRPH